MNIAVDFDGVIHGYSRGWQDGTIYDPPVPGAREGLTALRAAGHKITIFSSRLERRVSPVGQVAQESQLDEVRDWLDRYAIPYDTIASGKPIAHAYLDDRAYRFRGDWGESVAELTAEGADRSWCTP